MLRRGANLQHEADPDLSRGSAASPWTPLLGQEDEVCRRLIDVPLHEVVELVGIDLPDLEAEPLLERGVLPGCRIRRVRNSPMGDLILMVEGTLLALRRETASCLTVRRPTRRRR